MGNLTESTILPAGGLVLNYPPGTPSGQVDQTICQLTIAQPPKVPCSFGTLKSDLTDQEMIEYANKNIEHELKDNTGIIDNNQKSSSLKQNDQVHKGSPKKSKSDDKSSSELNPEQALEYVSQDGEDESKIKPNTKAVLQSIMIKLMKAPLRRVSLMVANVLMSKKGKEIAKLMKNLHLLQ